MREVRPFLTMGLMTEIEARRKAGQPVFRLDLGEPSEPPAEAVRRRAAEAVLGEPMRYTATPGTVALRARIAQWYLEEHAVEVDPARIIVTVGASAAFILLLLAGFEPGARIALPRPGYPAYRNLISALGFQPREADCGPGTDFHLYDGLTRALQARPDGLLFASPANPTGGMLRPAEVEALVADCRALGVTLVSDEIYHGLSFGTPCWTAARHEDVIVVNSFSKFWRMTGWRLGWIVAPPAIARRIEVLAQNLFLSPPAPSQVAALQALEAQADAAAAVQGYRRNLDLALQMLPANMGITRWARPDGAFYLYADVSPHTDDSVRFASRLLAATGVALAPGIDFDPVEGARWVRLSLAGNPGEVAAGLSAMAAWLHTGGH